ncbi:helix-turn-helix protein [Streptomyces sp. TLI_235]|nr:helix-turn-helix transcriptional regulator [Streptomyces sp. TLI_235]PBC71517.1 helix-turn-helix protein [Streptomyces sp. TLI_235]
MAETTATPFTDLVRNRRAKLGLSLRALADRCIDPVTGAQPIKFGWIDRLEKGKPVLIPGEVELRALAVGLDLPPARLQDEASVQFMGTGPLAAWSEDSSVRATVANMMDLSPADREELAEMVELFARRRRERREQSDS